MYVSLYIVQYLLLEAVKKLKLMKKYHQGSNTKALKKTFNLYSKLILAPNFFLWPYKC